MRRLVALVILLALPLQWTFAAVGEYCQHESIPTAQQHLGHHAHQHVDKPGSKENSKKGGADWDCPACHHLTGAFIALMVVVPVRVDARLKPQFTSEAIPQRAPDNPFRPPLTAGA